MNTILMLVSLKVVLRSSMNATLMLDLMKSGTEKHDERHFDVGFDEKWRLDAR